MSLQDLVAAECAQPNQLANFVNNFTTDKFHLHEDVWERDNLGSTDARASRLRHEDAEDLDEDEFEREADRRFFRNVERPGMFDTHEYEEFMKEPLDMMPPPPATDNLLASILKSFVSGSHSQHMRGRFDELPDLGLSDRDKAKIRDRAGIMGRHFYADQSQEFADDQMHHLMEALQIDHRRVDERELEDSWREASRTVTSTRTAAQWSREYSADAKADEFDDYDEMIRNTAENKLWMEENLHRASPSRWANNWEREYHRGDGQQWVNDYTSKSDHQIEEETMEAAWNDGNHDRLMEAAWGGAQQEVARNRTSTRNLTELTDVITKIDDPKLQASNFMQFMRKINKGQVTFNDNSVIEHDYAPSMMDDGLANNDWLREYDKFDEEDAYADPRDWAREYSDFTGSIAPDRLAEYEFVVNTAANPYSTHEDPMGAAIELFNKGMITEAILAFEMEVQRNPTNSAAWKALGQAHAENDKDNLAILSLEKAVEVDPQNLDALSALAVSYTNDFSRDKALDALEKWLRLNDEYSNIPADVNAHHRLPEGVPDFYAEAWSHHGRVVDMYLRAAQLRPDDPDPEVQTALGLLYNLSYEYDRAVDCFKAALTKRPNDYQLWNKLGATLANSNRGEEALGAYFKALEGKPTYVRARANLGISFLALNSYNEAAESFLSALKLHPNASHLWDNLKMVFRLMGRDDLEERAANNDIEAFGDDFRL